MCCIDQYRIRMQCFKINNNKLIELYRSAIYGYKKIQEDENSPHLVNNATKGATSDAETVFKLAKIY